MNKAEFGALYKKYGAATLSSVFGVPQPTVRRWNSVGLPKSRDAVARALETVQRHEGYEEQALTEMMALAKKSGKMPKVRTYEKRRDGETTTGYESSKAESGFLTEATLLKIRNHLEKSQLARGLPNWLASVTVSAFIDEAERAGSGDVRVQVAHEDANNFVVESIVSSGLAHSRKEAIDSIMSKLRQKMRDSDSRFFVHGTYFTTYQYKTQREILDRKNKKRAK